MFTEQYNSLSFEIDRRRRYCEYCTGVLRGVPGKTSELVSYSDVLRYMDSDMIFYPRILACDSYQIFAYTRQNM